MKMKIKHEAGSQDVKQKVKPNAILALRLSAKCFISCMF